MCVQWCLHGDGVCAVMIVSAGVDLVVMVSGDGVMWVMVSVKLSMVGGLAICGSLGICVGVCGGICVGAVLGVCVAAGTVVQCLSFQLGGG